MNEMSVFISLRTRSLITPLNHNFFKHNKIRVATKSKNYVAGVPTLMKLAGSGWFLLRVGT